MPDCGFWWGSSFEDRTHRHSGVNRGKGRGFTKPPINKRKRKR